MTAREYGLPAVVGVQHATRLICDGQRILLPSAPDGDPLPAADIPRLMRQVLGPA